MCVYKFVYIYVSSQCVFSWGLSLALQSPDQFMVSHWTPHPPFFFQVEGLIYYLHMWKCHRSQTKADFLGGSSHTEKILKGRGNPPWRKTSWNKKKMPHMGDTLTSQWVQIVALILRNTKIYNKFGLDFILFFSFFFQEGGRGGRGG